MTKAFRWVGQASDKNSVTLKRFDGKFGIASYANEAWMNQNASDVRIAAVLDLETTGFDSQRDQIIEIGIRKFCFNRKTGELLSVGDVYSSLNDPGRPIEPKISQLTGISDQDVKGKKIDWASVDRVLESVDLVIAHNASFDRPFMDRFSNVSSEKVWACSHRSVPWESYGYMSSKLELLSIYHGFFCDSHRALEDADALLYLITTPFFDDRVPYLRDLIQNARKQRVEMIATRSPFESKDELKKRGYRWDGQIKSWKKSIFKEELDDEVAWMEAIVYRGDFLGQFNEISFKDLYK